MSSPTPSQPSDNAPMPEASSRDRRGVVATSPAQTLEQVIEPVVNTMGYELVHLEWAASGRHRRLQIFVDHPDGIDLDDCASLSPVIGNALDAAEADPDAPKLLRAALAGAYVLEVSSPGLDRPLSRLPHFARFVGRRATIKTTEPLSPESKQRTFHGRLEAAIPDPDAPEDPHRGTVELHADDGGVHLIPLPLLKQAHLIYEG